MIRILRGGLLFASLLFAQPGSEPLTEDRAVELALGADPRIVALRHGVRAAELAPRGVGLVASPQVRYGLTDMAGDLNDPGYARNNVGLSWSPPRIGTFGLARRAAASRVEEASADLAAARIRVEAETRLAFRSAVLLDEQSRLAAEAARLRERILADVSEQVSAALATRLDRDAAELALAEARVTAEQVRSERLLHIVRLARQTGLEAAAIRLAPTPAMLEFEAPKLDADQLRKQAAGARPELRAASARCRLIEFGIAEKRRELQPWVSSLQTFRRTNRTTGTPDWGFQIGVEVPVFRWKENGIAPELARLEQCAASRHAVERSIAGEISELVARLEAVAAGLDEHRKALLELGAKHVDSARSMLAARQADRVQPLLAELRLVGLKQAYTARLLEYRVLETGLRQALGN